MNKPDRDWLFLASRADERLEKRAFQCLERDRDIESALALLEGLPKRDRGKQLLRFVLLSDRTEPTEKEGREALCRVLLSMAREYPPEDIRHRILSCLLSVFSPPFQPPFPVLPPSPFKAVLKRRNQGHADPWRDFAIATLVRDRRANGLSYDAAVAEVAEAFGYKDPRHVKTIYGKWKDELGIRSVKSDN